MSSGQTDQQEQPPFDEWRAALVMRRDALIDVRKNGTLEWSYHSDLTRALRELDRLQAENASLRERVQELGKAEKPLYCGGCGRIVSRDAWACPHCDAKFYAEVNLSGTL